MNQLSSTVDRNTEASAVEPSNQLYVRHASHRQHHHHHRKPSWISQKSSTEDRKSQSSNRSKLALPAMQNEQPVDDGKCTTDLEDTTVPSPENDESSSLGKEDLPSTCCKNATAIVHAVKINSEIKVLGYKVEGEQTKASIFRISDFVASDKEERCRDGGVANKVFGIGAEQQNNVITNRAAMVSNNTSTISSTVQSPAIKSTNNADSSKGQTGKFSISSILGTGEDTTKYTEPAISLSVPTSLASADNPLLNKLPWVQWCGNEQHGALAWYPWLQAGSAYMPMRLTDGELSALLSCCVIFTTELTNFRRLKMQHYNYVIFCLLYSTIQYC